MPDFPGGYFPPGTNTDNVTTVDAAYRDTRDAEINAIETALGSDLVPGTGGSPTYPLRDRVRIYTNGNLGIGTAQPATELHVNRVMTLDATANPATPSAGRAVLFLR